MTDGKGTDKLHSIKSAADFLDREVDFLTRWCHIRHEGAAEVIAEMRDTKSLLSLAGYRVARAAEGPAAHKLDGLR